MSQIHSKCHKNLIHNEQNKDLCQNIDQKTRQVLFFECDLQLVKQTFLKNNEKFTEQHATHLLEKYIRRRRKSKCTAYFLTDRIRFQQRKVIGIKPFRKEVIYREIRHFFVFPNHPEVFMICIVDENKDKRSYELYQCIDYNAVGTVCNLTYKASIDTFNTLHETIPLKWITLTSTSPPTIKHYTRQDNEYPEWNRPLNEIHRNVNRRTDFVKPSENIVTDKINNHYRQNDCDTKLTLNVAKVFPVHDDDDDADDDDKREYMMNEESRTKTVNISEEAINSPFSYDDLKLFHSKFYSLHNLCPNKPDITSTEMNPIENDIHYEYTLHKLLPYSRNNHEQLEIFHEDNRNKTFKSKPFRLTSLSPAISVEESDFNKYVDTKQDLLSTNYHCNSTFVDTRRSSILSSHHLSSPLVDNHEASLMKTFTLAKGNSLVCHKKRSHIYQDVVDMKNNDDSFYDNNSDDFGFQNHLRKCKSTMDIRLTDTTYLCYDPVVGVRINNKGPIYMYMERYNSIHYCVDLGTY
ncbi:unnamed protein product [Schistosoma turkestanicum]|nr:unnamed protein product [Schistosoma turkestanicum]